jgi:hypothetical protein
VSNTSMFSEQLTGEKVLAFPCLQLSSAEASTKDYHLGHQVASYGAQICQE